MRTLKLLTIACLCFTFSSSYAIEGYKLLGYGSICKSMGGAGVAYYKTSIIGGNPAGNVFLGKQYSFASSFNFPTISYTVTGDPSGVAGTFPLSQGTVNSDANIIFIPAMGANWQINEKSAFGVSLYGTGITTNYPTQTFHDSYVNNTGISFKQIISNPTYSFKINDKHAFGVSALLMLQMFEINGLTNFASYSNDAEHLTNNGTDTNVGAGIKLGYLGEALNGLHVGASYESRTYATKMEKYTGLLAEEGGYDAPATWTVGLKYDISDKMSVLADVKKIYYSNIKSLGNPLSKLTEENNLLGTDDGAGFGWEDVTALKIGAEYKTCDDITFRGGYAYGEQPMHSSEVFFNILAAAVSNQHITLGGTKKIGEKKKDLNLAFVYTTTNSIAGTNTFDPTQNIEIEMEIFEVEIGITF